MDTDDKPKVEVKKSTVASGRVKNVIGSIAVLAVAVLAGLVFTRYEAGIPPADDALASAATQFIPVTISEQNLANRMPSAPAHSQHAAPAPRHLAAGAPGGARAPARASGWRGGAS